MCLQRNRIVTHFQCFFSSDISIRIRMKSDGKLFLQFGCNGRFVIIGQVTALHWTGNSSSSNQLWQRWSAYLSVFMIQRLHTINASSSLASAILAHWSKYKYRNNIIFDKSISQIPKCTCSLSHNAPFRTEMCTFLFWMDHCRIWDRSIAGFVNYVNYCTKNYASTSTL